MSTPTEKLIQSEGPVFPDFLRGKQILLATESFGPVNGVSKTTLNLVEYLRENGVKVAVVAPDTNSKSKVTSTTSAGSQVELRVKGYPLPYNPELSVVYPVQLSTLYSRTFSMPPDLIYLASPASLGFQILLQLRYQQRQRRVPVLLNFQTDLSGYCEILFPAPLDTWAVWVFRMVQGYLFRHGSVKTVFYPSDSVRRYLEKANIQPEKMMNLRRGVDGELFCPSKRCEKLRGKLALNGEVILVTVARLAPEKGFEFMAKCVKQLDAMGVRFKLLVVGGNRNPQVEQDVKNLFGTLVDERKVTFTGFLKGEDLARAYASGDGFLHCSITETFGLVVLESMASGVPVVARDEGGPREMVEHGRTGYLVPPNDLDEFVQRTLALINDTELRKMMGLESRRSAEGQTWESIGNKVAWSMAETLSSPEPIQESRSFVFSVYSWLIRSPELRNHVAASILDFKLMGGISIIFGVWLGLVITWVLVQLMLAMRGKPR
ncbi:glycosyltransferase family 4 protein [Calycina marina]|uniref:Glycosyltransferase family 4 protein n=1 Tax=Calycina marina TaxID=1763456 RepID=A0A9P7YYW3_9HELO|nr:glycosyltransferase family 4 protein [Calycina marina]